MQRVGVRSEELKMDNERENQRDIMAQKQNELYGFVLNDTM